MIQKATKVRTVFSQDYCILIWGAGGTRDAPGSSNSFIFMQFSAKNMQNKFLGILAHSSQENPGYATVYLLPPANEAPSVHGGRGCQGRSASRGVCLGGSASRAGGVCIPGGSASRAGGVCIQGVCLGGSASWAGGVCIPGGGLHPGKEGSASRGGSASHGVSA